MAFWGVDVKPGRPVTLEPTEAIGIKRLHLSMATLGFGQALSKSTLQCNVGNKSPVLLCALTPDKVDCLQLNLKFQEADKVVFSVIGPRSIHLSGYFLDMCTDFMQSDDESEPYGEDICDTDMERSSSDDYDYNDSFINDGDISCCDSHVPSNDDDEISSIKELAAKTRDNERKGRGGRLRKKFQTSDETLVRANDDDSLNDDSIQVCNIDNNYKNPKVLSSVMPLTLENGGSSAKYEKKTLEATVHTSKTLENGWSNENCEKRKKISEATTLTDMSLDQREDNQKSLGAVELSAIIKGCETISKRSVVINSQDREEKAIPERLENEKLSADKEMKSSSDALPSPTNQKRKRETKDVWKQAIEENMEKEDGGAKEREISSSEMITEENEKGTSAVKSDD